MLEVVYYLLYLRRNGTIAKQTIKIFELDKKNNDTFENRDSMKVMH